MVVGLLYISPRRVIIKKLGPCLRYITHAAANNTYLDAHAVLLCSVLSLFTATKQRLQCRPRNLYCKLLRISPSWRGGWYLLCTYDVKGKCYTMKLQLSLHGQNLTTPWFYRHDNTILRAEITHSYYITLVNHYC